MDLLFILNDLENTVLASLNGVAHYDIRTAKLTDGPSVTYIQRPADAMEGSVVAEIQWKFYDKPTFIYSHLLPAKYQDLAIPASRFLNRRHRFSPCRYFVGDDGRDYRWKFLKGIGCVLVRLDTHEEVARSMNIMIKDGFFSGERKSVLRIQPCTLDVDLIIISFVIMEKKRIERDGIRNRDIPHDEDPAGDGGGSGAVDGGLGEV